jgi:hypothetical protein
MAEKPPRTVQEVWNSRPKGEQQQRDESDLAYGTWRDPDCPPDGYPQEGGSFAEQLAALRPTEKSVAYGVYDNAPPASASAATIANSLFSQNRQPAEEPPSKPASKGVPELMELYAEADLIYDDRMLYGGTENMTPAQFRTFWGRR